MHNPTNLRVGRSNRSGRANLTRGGWLEYEGRRKPPLFICTCRRVHLYHFPRAAAGEGACFRAASHAILVAATVVALCPPFP
jgi:hypothetical protein